MISCGGSMGVVCAICADLGRRTFVAELVQGIVAEDNDAGLENLTGRPGIFWVVVT